MRRSLIAVTAFLLSINVGAKSAFPQQDSTERSAEQEIRAALCDIDSGDFTAAEKRLEKVLLSDPRNIYAQRLLPAMITRQVKLGDKSPENIALARKAIEAIQHALNNPQFPSKAKEAMDRQILRLYGQIGQEEFSNELRRRASDSKRRPTARAEFYTVLASEFWECSYRITELPTNKLTTANPNKLAVSYKMPKDPKDFQAARMCVTRGIEEIENAIKFDPNSEFAWSYKTNLLTEASKLAEMEGNPAQKALYQKQSDEARKRTEEISARREKEREEKWKNDQEVERQDEQTSLKQSAAKQPDDREELTKELTEYKAETTLDLDKAVEEFSDEDELASLVAPVPIATDPIAPESGDTTKQPESIPKKPPQGCFREVDGPAQVLEKREWKSFSPAGENITVELPDNLCPGAGGYLAASEGVMYSIFPLARPSIPLDPTVVDRVLNTLARSFIGSRSRTWMGGGNSFEVKLVRKETVNDQPSKVYAYALISCSKRKDGMLIVYAGKTHYYTVDISGANESDQRVQRFLKSVRFK
jgi:hypothetical protein